MGKTSKQSRTRGFEIAKGYENKGVTIPKPSTVGSAGSDLRTLENVALEPWKTTPVHTGLKAYMQEGEVLKIYARSGLSTKRDVVISNQVGIIDQSYYGNPTNDGEIIVALYNRSNTMIYLDKGERIAQGIFEPYLKSDNDDTTTERTGGFGSTGNK